MFSPRLDIAELKGWSLQEGIIQSPLQIILSYGSMDSLGKVRYCALSEKHCKAMLLH